MKQFHEMLRKVTSSPHHDKMMQFVKPLHDHFGINHFWYYRINHSGSYCYLGSHAHWSEFCFDRSIVDCFPCLRHPSILQSGISLMKACSDEAYQNTLRSAWDNFQINFNINLPMKVSDGIEAFGFASRFDDPKSDERLLNELALLRQFTKAFRQELKPLFQLLDDNQVNLAAHFGSIFYERPKALALPPGRDQLYRQLGVSWISELSPREKDVLHYLASGYSASFIASSLALGTRTVENYIATIKSKLHCTSKHELIQKAKQLEFLY